MSLNFSELYRRYYPLYLFNRKKMRNSIRNKNFTLITPNCMAGLIYHDLGLRFLSPTINLQIFPYDKFLLNIRHYCSAELEFIPSEQTFPVAKLGGDVLIWFTHYHSEEEARQKWHERAKRINWDNLYILGSEIEIDTPEKMQQVSDNVPCKKLLIFTFHPYQIPNTLYLPVKKGSDYPPNLIKINFLAGKRGYEKAVDIVKWLND